MNGTSRTTLKGFYIGVIMEKNIAELKLDWITFTFLPPVEVIPVIDRAGEKVQMHLFDYFCSVFDTFQPMVNDALFARGKFSYDYALYCSDSIQIFYDSENSNKGVCVSVPSSGLNKLYKLLGSEDIYDLLNCLNHNYCRISRMDICFDDYEKIIHPWEYAVWFQQDLFDTHYRKISYICSQFHKGDTFYCGSRATGKMLRVYDKEYESNGQIDAIRYEFELRGDYARALQQHYLDNEVIDFSELILSFFDIKERSGNHMNDYKRLDRWSMFLTHVSRNVKGKINPPVKTEPTSIEKARKWVNSIKKSLAFAANIIGIDDFISMLEHCQMSDLHKKLLYDYFKDRNEDF